MLGLTLLMVVVAILVGLIAARVSASIGRDLRRETFSSVIHFSNAEIENFSTASLITRTTNDIQQVQFVCVILLRMVAYAPILGIGGVMHVVQGNTGLAWIIVLDVAALLLIVFGSDERCHAQIQDHANAGGPAEPRQPRDPDRRHAGARLQPRIL